MADITAADTGPTGDHADDADANYAKIERYLTAPDEPARRAAFAGLDDAVSAVVDRGNPTDVARMVGWLADHRGQAVAA